MRTIESPLRGTCRARELADHARESARTAAIAVVDARNDFHKIVERSRDALDIPGYPF